MHVCESAYTFTHIYVGIEGLNTLLCSACISYFSRWLDGCIDR